MFIIAQNDKTYARLRFNVGPGAQMAIPVEVDYAQSFPASDKTGWEAEYQANIILPAFNMNLPMGKEASPGREDYRDYAWPADIVDQIEALDPAERQAVLDELADRTELWGEEVGVCL